METPRDWKATKSAPPTVCYYCLGRRYTIAHGQSKTACPICSTTCPECGGIGCLRGEEGPDPCQVCAGQGFALLKHKHHDA